MVSCDGKYTFLKEREGEWGNASAVEMKRSIDREREWERDDAALKYAHRH